MGPGAAGDPQPRRRRGCAGCGPGVPCRKYGCSIMAMRAASTTPGSAGRSRAGRVPGAGGLRAAYRTIAVTRDGEHGNALLSRWPVGDVAHADVSDHRFEQRGLLHVRVRWQGTELHAIVAHFARSMYQPGACAAPRPVCERAHSGRRAGHRRRRLQRRGRTARSAVRPAGLARSLSPQGPVRAMRTFPSRMPLFSLDRVYTAGCTAAHRHGAARPAWVRMSDHLPLLVELEPA